MRKLCCVLFGLATLARAQQDFSTGIRLLRLEQRTETTDERRCTQILAQRVSPQMGDLAHRHNACLSVFICVHLWFQLLFLGSKVEVNAIQLLITNTVRQKQRRGGGRKQNLAGNAKGSTLQSRIEFNPLFFRGVTSSCSS